MICSNCEKKCENEEIEYLSHKKNKCKYCSDLSKKIDYIKETSLKVYKKNLFYKITSLDDNINNINEYILNKNFKSEEVRDKYEILRILYQIVGLVTDDINYIINKNPSAFLISVLSFLEYNMFLTIQTFEMIENFNNERFETYNNDELSMMLSEIFVNFRYKNKEEIETFIGRIKQILTKDKQSIQYSIKIINKEIYKNKRSKELFEKLSIEYSEIENILNLIEIYEEINSIAEAYCHGIYNIESLKIDKNGICIKYEDDKFDYNYEKEIDILSNNEVFSKNPIEFDEKLDEILDKHFGIKLNNIINAHKKLVSLYDKEIDNFFVGTYNSFVNLFKNIMNIDKDKAQKIVKIFIADYNNIDNTWINERALQKCLLILFDDILCVPIDILAISILNFSNIMLSGKTSDDPIRREIQALNRKLNDKFEIDVANLIKDNFFNSKVKVNVSKIENFSDGEKYRIILPGEVDVLAFINGYIYVIECKDFNIKIDFREDKNERRDLKKAEKKLYKKIEELNKNINYLIKYLDIDKSKLKDKEIRGIIVTSGISRFNFSKEGIYPIKNVKSLINFIKEQNRDII